MSYSANHVPVGAGVQTPYVYTQPVPQVQPQPVAMRSNQVTVVLTQPSHGHFHGPTVLNVPHGGSIPARQVPPGALNTMRARVQAPPQTGLTIVAAHAQNQADIRQIPGTNYAIATPKKH